VNDDVPMFGQETLPGDVCAGYLRAQIQFEPQPCPDRP